MDAASPFTTFSVSMDADRTLGARLYPAAPARRLPATLILGHGAGAGQQSAFMTAFGRGLSARGVDVVTFNFPYIEARRHVPDKNAVLETAWRQVIATVRSMADLAGTRLFIGGKSMGGRIASQVAAAPQLLPAPVDGLVLLGYPLHPPSQPERRRDAHLGRIGPPMLFVQGERDAFGNAEEMRQIVTLLPGAELHLVEAANHSLQPPRRFAHTPDEVLAAVQDHIVAWMTRVIADLNK